MNLGGPICRAVIGLKYQICVWFALQVFSVYATQNNEWRCGMRGRDDSFGATVRRLREEQRIGLRKFAQLVGMSPTYLSKVERDEFKPPTEEKVRAIAEALGQDPDELLALAGRVSTDLTDIIQRHPREMATFLRAANGLSAEQMRRLAEEALRKKKGD